MSESIKHFLIVFDHGAGKLEELVEFEEDSDRAVQAYAAKEAELKGRQLVEIVLIGSDSLATVKLTHANYFEPTAPPVSKYLVGLMVGGMTAAILSRRATGEPSAVVQFSGMEQLNSKS